MMIKLMSTVLHLLMFGFFVLMVAGKVKYTSLSCSYNPDDDAQGCICRPYFRLYSLKDPFATIEQCAEGCKTQYPYFYYAANKDMSKSYCLCIPSVANCSTGDVGATLYRYLTNDHDMRNLQ